MSEKENPENQNPPQAPAGNMAAAQEEAKEEITTLNYRDPNDPDAPRVKTVSKPITR